MFHVTIKILVWNEPVVCQAYLLVNYYTPSYHDS